MADASEVTDQLTLTDIEVGVRLVEALVRHAKTDGAAPITHEALLTLGRHMHPKDAVLGRAVPVGIGAKVRFVQDFCAAVGYPNLACMAVHKGSLRPGPGCQGDPDAERRACARFGWPDLEARLAAYAAERRAGVPRRFKPRQERPADVAWYAYFCSHRAACAQITGDDKKEIINLLMAGLDPETALRRVLAAKAALGGA